MLLIESMHEMPSYTKYYIRNIDRIHSETVLFVFGCISSSIRIIATGAILMQFFETFRSQIFDFIEYKQCRIEILNGAPIKKREKAMRVSRETKKTLLEINRRMQYR